MNFVYVTTDGGEHWIDGRKRPSVTLAQAVEQAKPGDLIRLLPGTYTIHEPLRLTTSGTAEEPIIIRGEIGSVLDGRRLPDWTVHATDPTLDRFAALQLDGVEHVQVDNLSVRNCWPSAIYCHDVRNIRLRKLDIVGGSFAVFASGENTYGIELTDSSWLQDERIWRGLNWALMHDLELEEFPYPPYRYMNGAFFGSRDIKGGIKVLRNDVRHFYNAVRMDVATELAGMNYVGKYSIDVEIAYNRFAFCRDNVAEPEKNAVNWWVHHNEVYNAHKWFSVHDVNGGFWYFFGNTGWFDSLPGPEGDSNNGGAVFKFRKLDEEDRRPSLPFEVFHNSWYLRQKFIKKGQTQHFHHRNNVISYAEQSELPEGLMPEGQQFIGPKAILRPEHDDWFEGDVCNHEDFPSVLERRNVFGGGTHIEGRLFKSGATGDVRLAGPAAQLTATPVTIPMPDGTEWNAEGDQSPGALTGDKPYEGPKFRELDLDYLKKVLAEGWKGDR